MLKIHFINVGKGNCTVIDFPSGHLTVVDTDNSRNTEENDLTDPIDFIKKQYPNHNLYVAVKPEYFNILEDSLHS
jgi:hypothetical protein